MAKIKYGEKTLAEITTGQTLTLHLEGHEMEHDIEIEGFASGGSGGTGGEMTGIGADIYVVYGGQLWDFFTFVSVAFPDFGVTRENSVIAVADELPLIPETVDALRSYWVIKSTGIKYLRDSGMWIDFTTFSQLPDHGWISKAELDVLDFTSDSNIGLYAVERDCNPFIERNFTSLTGDYDFIGQYAFLKCDVLMSIDLPNTTSIGEYAFYNCNVLTSIDLPNATIIGNGAFSSCEALTSIDLPNVTSIGDFAFCECHALTSIDLPNVTSTGYRAFYYCNALTSIDLPNATIIGNGAFSSCEALTSVVLPNATSIGDSVFYDCYALTSIDLPNATSIGDRAFYNCDVLTSVIIRTPEVCVPESNAFNNTPISKGTGYIYVPADLVEAYKTTDNWSAYASQIRAIEDYPEICG